MGCTPGVGVPWIDEPGEDDVLVRTSRSAGLPAPAPDVLGLALRVPQPDGSVADLLLATTGTGALGRYLLLPTRSGQRPHTSLLPHRSPSGPLLLAAVPRSLPGSYDLACASPFGRWRAFGRLRVDPDPLDPVPDPPVRFDAVLHPLEELPAYDWVALLREPSYAAAREHGDPGLTRG